MITGKKKVRREYSAGGAVFRRQDNKILWLVIKPKGKDRWQLPKGWIDEGEDSRVAAVREVAEEGGVRAEAIEKIDTISIFFHSSYEGAPREFINKKIAFFLMKFLGRTKKGPDPKEVDRVEWLPYSDAYERLTFKSEKEILKKAQEILEEKSV